MYYNADARCQVDGTCSENSCGYNDGDDECDDGELFSDNTCLAICSDDVVVQCQDWYVCCIDRYEEIVMRL